MMTQTFYISLTCLLASAIFTNAAAKTQRASVVYGKDNRVDLRSVFDQRIEKLGESIAARVMSYSYIEYDDYIAFEDFLILSDDRSVNVCAEERFANQSTISDCTAFLISDRLMATAGHCVAKAGETLIDEVSSACEDYSWMFDYKIERGSQLDLENIDSEKIYSCKRVVYAIYEENVDFAIIELDRPVVGRTPLKLSTSFGPLENLDIFVMGHPNGLPMKYAGGANIFDIDMDDHYFTTNLDTFGGNSGSPVFNSETFEVEGILVRGDTDYYSQDLEGGGTCMKVNRCNSFMENCISDNLDIEGEHVTFISKIVEGLVLYAPEGSSNINNTFALYESL